MSVSSISPNVNVNRARPAATVAVAPARTERAGATAVSDASAAATCRMGGLCTTGPISWPANDAIHLIAAAKSYRALPAAALCTARSAAATAGHADERHSDGSVCTRAADCASAAAAAAASASSL